MALETWVIGAIINLIGSILINLGTNIIKYHYHKLEKSRYTRPHATSSASAASDGTNPFSPRQSKSLPPSSSRSKTWWIGFCVFTIGNITNFVSMGFAAQSLLAGLGSVQFISNVVFSSCVLKQQVTNRILLATFAIVVGNMLIVVFASHESGKMSVDELWNLYSNTAYKVYMTILLCLVVVLYVFYKEYKKRIFREYPGIHGKVLAGHKLLPCAYAAISGIIGTQSVLLAKSSSELVRTSIAGVNQFVYPFTYLILTAWIGSMLFWLYRMNAALRKFDGVFIIPVLQVVWTLFSIIGGGIYFQEFNTFTPIQIALFTLGVLIVMFGVYLLAPQQTAPGQRIISGGEHSSDIGSRNSELHNLRASSSSYSASTSPAPFNMPTQIRLALAVRHASSHFHHVNSQPGSTSGSVNNSGHHAPIGSGSGLDLIHSESNVAGYTTFINDNRTSSIGSDIIQYTDSPTHTTNKTKITMINTSTISATPTPIVSSPTSPHTLTVGPQAIAHADAQVAAAAASSARSPVCVSPGIGQFTIELGPSPTSPMDSSHPLHERSYSDHGGNEARRIDIEDSYSVSVPSSPRTTSDERRSRAMSMGFTMPTFDIEQESGTEEEITEP